MKNIFIGFICFVFIVLINGCSSNPEPQFRIRNEQLNKVNVSVQTSTGNKINIHDIDPGQTTAYQSASVGNITATSVVQNESVSFPAEKNTRYTIVISQGKPPEIQIEK